jgi:predicted metalloprotease with PDZ domain
MVPADAREEWFKEGVTDYLTVVTMARNGLIDRELVFKRLENSVRRVTLARMMHGRTETIRAAGADKAANLLLVYGGGALAGLALDVELRLRSNGRVGLPELTRELYAATGHGERPYTLDDITLAAGQMTDSDFGDFLAQTVESDGLIDIGPALEALGLRLDQFYDEVYVSVVPSASAQQRGRFVEVFGLPSD